MTIIVAVAHSAEGRAALAAAADEARRLDTPLVAVNLGSRHWTPPHSHQISRSRSSIGSGVTTAIPSTRYSTRSPIDTPPAW